MARQRVDINGFANEIINTLQEFADATLETVENAVKTTSKEAVRELKSAHPQGSGQFGSWSDYNKSWKVTQTKTDKRYHKSATIHNVEHYQLTHLLEHGHEIVSHGKKAGKAGEFEHIAPVMDKAENDFMERIKRGIENA